LEFWLIYVYYNTQAGVQLVSNHTKFINSFSDTGQLFSKPNSTLNFKNDWRPAEHQLVCYNKHKLAKPISREILEQIIKTLP
jgi:hypothetical protein